MIASASTDVPSVVTTSGDLQARIEHECLSANELAAYLRVNRKTVYEYAARNVIPCRRLGRRLVFSRAAIVAWLARQTAALTPGAVR